MTKEKALYQAKLILENLPTEEYDLIPKDIVNYIEENMEYDDNIIINPNESLENQNIDNKTYDILEDILKKIDLTQIEDIKVEEQDDYDSIKNENIKLKDLTESLKKENAKILQIKDLVNNYKNELNKKNIEIEKLKAQNQDMYNCIKNTPWIVRKVFFKGYERKLLN